MEVKGTKPACPGSFSLRLTVDMSQPENQPVRRRSRDVDITKSLLSQWMTPRLSWIWAPAFFLSLLVILVLGDEAWHFGGLATLSAPVVLIVMLVASRIAWILLVRRGMLTWMRLARAPARAMARGDAIEAERLYQRALQRSRRFSDRDHRRGMMLFELAGYVKNQGRYPESQQLFEECIEILSEQPRSLDYLIALNNYAIYFIHLRDHAAAQGILEKVLDLTLVKKKTDENHIGRMPHMVLQIELVLHLNLVFLFIEMKALGEAQDHMDEADAICVGMNKHSSKLWRDHYIAMRALLMFALGRFADSSSELDKAGNREYGACLRIRARHHLLRREFAQAEPVLRKYLALERKKGSLHRPELRDHSLDLAECLFGQGRHDEAFTALLEATAIAADFSLPPENCWRQSMETWLHRAKTMDRIDVAASLAAELQKMPATPQQGIMISEKLRVRPAVRRGS
jgi:Tetratricopeptide repeat